MKIDRNERIRRWINIQIVKLQQVASVGALLLMILSNALIINQYIVWRGIHPYVGITLVFVGLLVLVLFLAHIYIRMLEMNRTQKRAELELNPYAVYAFGPFEEVLWRTLHIPTLEAAWINIPDDNPKKKEIGELLNKAKKWVDLGYIPREDYPKHLLGFYKTKIERRLD